MHDSRISRCCWNDRLWKSLATETVFPMMIVKWYLGVQLTDEGVKFGKLWDKWIFVQFHSSMLQTNIMVMVWSMFGERCWFVVSAEIVDTRFVSFRFCTGIEFRLLCIWLSKRWIHRVSALAAGVVSFLEMLMPAQLCVVSKYFWGLVGAIGVWVLPYFPDPLIFDRSVANHCRSKVIGCVQVCLVTLWYVRHAGIRNSNMLIAIARKNK